MATAPSGAAHRLRRHAHRRGLCRGTQRDGIPDLIEDNYAADTIWVLLGQGDGTFGDPDIYPTDDGGHFQGPLTAKAADVSGDGIPDLIYPYIGSNVVVRVGNGDGTFGPERKFAARLGAYEPYAVDVNGDGKPDLVVANAVDNSVSVLLGNGDATFQPQKVYPVGVNPYSMAMADVNGDGRPDFITSNRDDNTVSVLLGNGDGTFRRSGPPGRQDFPTRGRGDFTRWPGGLVTANQGESTASVLLATGTAPSLRPGEHSRP
jgi:DNA-binding beta-propeller fold protein YncE